MKLTRIQIIFLSVGAVVLVSLGVLVGYFIVKSKSTSKCIPDCKNKKCGDSDGCDGSCSYCDNNLTCNLKGECVPGGSTPTPKPSPC